MIATSEINQITREIHILEGYAVDCAQRAVQLKVEIGLRLIRAKEILPHGKFGEWAQSEFGWSKAWTAKHMELARNAPRVSSLPPDTGLRAALAAIAGPSEPKEPTEAPAKLRFSLVANDGEFLELEFKAESEQALFCKRLHGQEVKVYGV